MKHLLCHNQGLGRRFTASPVSLLGLLCLLLFSWGITAEPYTPAEDEVIAVLPSPVPPRPALNGSGAEPAGPKEYTHQQRIEAAADYIAMAYRNNDSRAFGYAQAQLRPWWNSRDVPVPVGIMKATILQHNHQFTKALASLDEVLQKQPENAQARLMRAQIYLAGGKYESARSDCRRLAFRVSTALATNCLAQVNSLTGQALSSYALLEELVGLQSYISAGDMLELKTTLANIAQRLGKDHDAEAYYREALAQDPGNSYLLTHLSDLLMQQQRYQELIALLQDLPEHQLTLEMEVYLLQAYQKTDHQFAESYRHYLLELFDTAFARQDGPPHKEYAQFSLYVLNRPDLALPSAKANWAYQKEPGDALLLLRVARIAADTTLIEEIREWVNETGLEDYRIDALLDQEP